MISIRLCQFLCYCIIPISPTVYHECFFGYLWIQFCWFDVQNCQNHIKISDSTPRVGMAPFFACEIYRIVFAKIIICKNPTVTLQMPLCSMPSFKSVWCWWHRAGLCGLWHVFGAPALKRPCHHLMEQQWSIHGYWSRTQWYRLLTLLGLHMLQHNVPGGIHWVDRCWDSKVPEANMYDGPGGSFI